MYKIRHLYKVNVVDSNRRFEIFESISNIQHYLNYHDTKNTRADERSKDNEVTTEVYSKRENVDKILKEQKYGHHNQIQVR